jgi:hypothetical protein
MPDIAVCQNFFSFCYLLIWKNNKDSSQKYTAGDELAKPIGDHV